MLQDLGYALRRLRNQPGYAAAAVLALALGIGCTTAIFSVMQAVLLRTLPVPRPERLVSLLEDQPQFPDASLSAPDFLDLKAQIRSFESVSAYFGMRMVLTGIDRPERVIGSETDGDYFQVLQASAMVGRLYGRGSSGEVVLSERLWRRIFGADPRAVGRCRWTASRAPSWASFPPAPASRRATRCGSRRSASCPRFPDSPRG